jgi:hypothetical protein
MHKNDSFGTAFNVSQTQGNNMIKKLFLLRPENNKQIKAALKYLCPNHIFTKKSVIVKCIVET